jgi:hypothetical protein
MNIGILTFHRGPNYGGYLQAWHLREAVRRLGHHAELINYQNPSLRASERPILHNYHPGTLRHAFRSWLKCRPFHSLVKNFSPFPFTTDPAAVPWGDFDTIIVGSDVVWDFQTPHFGHDPTYFGAQASQQNTRFISYAASCGPANPNGQVPDWVKQGLRRFSAISVRDASTQELAMQATGATPELVVDPTWLNEDQAPLRSIAPHQPYLLLYGNCLDATRAAELRKFCRKRGWIIVGAACEWKYADITLNGFDPFQWVELFQNAQAIVTATLHGLLYSIKSRKPFLMVSMPAAANKSRTVLERVGALDRLVDPAECFGDHRLELLATPESPVPDSPWIEASRNYLSKALSSTPS